MVLVTLTNCWNGLHCKRKQKYWKDLILWLKDIYCTVSLYKIQLLKLRKENKKKQQKTSSVSGLVAALYLLPNMVTSVIISTIIHHVAF